MGRLKSVPKYLKHSSGQAHVVINGRTHYLGIHGSAVSRERYDALIAEWLASGRSKSFGVLNVGVLLSDVIIAYIKHCEAYYPQAENSETELAKAVLRVVARLYRDLQVEEFGIEQFKAVREVLLTDPNCQRKKPVDSPKPLSRSYINRQMKRLARMFKWAAGEGILHPDIYAAVRLVPNLKKGRTVAPETKPVRPVELTAIKQAIEHTGPVVAAMVQVQLLTGARPGEVCKLMPGTIDLSGEVWVVKLDEHKTAHHGQERVIYIGPQAQEVLQPFLDRADDKPLFSPAESELH